MAVPEQIPVVNYVADGVVKKFDVPFGYDQQSDLHLYVDGVEPTIDKYFFADNAFNFYIAPTVGQDVKIKRTTPKERNTDYDLHTSTVRPRALNSDFDRLWYVLQEVFSDVGGLSQAVQDEIIARIQGDEDLLNQLTSEISARMLGDEAVTEDLKNYVNQVVGTIIGDPSFTGIDANKVNDASGETQQQVNYNGGSKWHSRVGGYKENELAVLDNGNIVKSTIDGNTNNPNTNMTGWSPVDKKSSVNTIAELATIVNPKDGYSVYVKGYYAPENFALLIPYIGGGFRTYVESRKTENDEMFCINGWVLDTYENAYQVGARAKEGFDNLDIFQTILDKNLPLKLSDGVHEIRYPLVANTSSTILGAGTNSTIIRKTTRNKVTDNPKQSGRVVVFPVIGGGGATYSIDVDAILATAPKDYAANYNYYLRIDSVTFDRELPDDGTNYMVHHNASFTDTGYGQYGWFFPYLCQSTIINSRCFNNEYGIYTINTWMNLFQRVQWRASNGVVFGGLDGDINRGGTSTNLTNCWVTDVMGGAGHWAWRIHNMDYSFWSSIGTDFVGREGETPADGVLLVTSGTTGADTTLTISGFGSEVVHAKQYLKASGKLTLKGSSWTALDWFNKYGTQSTHLFEATDEAKVSLDLPNFKFMHEVNNPSASYYADQPKFAVASWGSTLEFEHPKVFPKITGKNDTGRFGLQAFQNSTIRFKTRTSELIAVAGTDDDALENASDHNKFITNQGIQSDSTSIDSGMVASTACRWDTNQLRLGNQYLWYSPTYDKWLYSTSKPTSETSGSILGDDALSGTTANRPTTYPLRRTGGCYFDQTIGKPIWWGGSVWKDANGTTV